MKVMAIDLGDARTGIAISDAMGWLTGFTTVIHSWNKDKTAQEIAALAAQGSSRITHTEFIDRGYADFAQKLTTLGGQIARETPRGADCPKKRTSKT